MGNVYVISDLHFGHKNMAIKRGFDTVEDHDQHIIDKWNSVVDKGDTCWILGDITMERSSPYYLLDLLKGYKKVVLGNHDKPQHVQELLKHVNLVCGSFRYKDKTILTHIPIHESEFRTFNRCVHGHIHQNKIDDNRYINVSAEAIDYTPKLISERLRYG